MESTRTSVYRNSRLEGFGFRAFSRQELQGIIRDLGFEGLEISSLAVRLHSRKGQGGSMELNSMMSDDKSDFSYV